MDSRELWIASLSATSRGKPTCNAAVGQRFHKKKNISRAAAAEPGDRVQIFFFDRHADAEAVENRADFLQIRGGRMRAGGKPGRAGADDTGDVRHDAHDARARLELASMRASGTPAATETRSFALPSFLAISLATGSTICGLTARMTMSAKSQSSRLSGVVLMPSSCADRLPQRSLTSLAMTLSFSPDPLE